MPAWTPAIDTTDLNTWDDEGVALFVEHVGNQFEGSVGILARTAMKSGNIHHQRKALHMFMTEMLPGGVFALEDLNKKAAPIIIPKKQTPFTLEEWEDLTLIKTETAMARKSPKKYEEIAKRTGETVEEVRRRLWKKMFIGYTADTWRPFGRTTND